MGYSIGVLNNIRNNSSQEYQNRIPEATQTNIVQIGNALSTYPVLANEFFASLINKIGKTLIEQKLFKNKLARFKSGAILSQQDVEEIFIEMSKAEGAYNPAGPNPLGRRSGPDVKVVYHRMNRQDVYPVTIGDLDVLRVFRSEATLDSFITGLINSVYSGAAYDEWLAMKNLLCTYDGYADVCLSEGPIEDMAELAKRFVKTVRKVVADLTVAPSTNYNKAGVNTWSNPGDLCLLVNKDLLAEVDVEVLAKSFNMGKTDIQIEVIPMDNLPFEKNSEDSNELALYSNLVNPLALLIDKDFFRVWDTLSHMEPQRNAEGLFTNYFYHVHQILSLSPFKNAVLIGEREV